MYISVKITLTPTSIVTVMSEVMTKMMMRTAMIERLNDIMVSSAKCTYYSKSKNLAL